MQSVRDDLRALGFWTIAVISFAVMNVLGWILLSAIITACKCSQHDIGTSADCGGPI